MEDTLVTLETARQAKEKGFDWNVIHAYKDGIVRNSEWFEGYIDEIYYNPNIIINRTKYKEVVSAPNQALLQRWLRDMYNIEVVITINPYSDLQLYSYKVYKMVDDGLRRIAWKVLDDSYEEALEEALSEALQTI